MVVKGIEMSLIYNKVYSKIVLLISEMSRDKLFQVYSKIVLLISEMSRDKLFHTGNAHTSFSLSKYTAFMLPFLVVKVLRWL